jgi:hypothetical protein
MQKLKPGADNLAGITGRFSIKALLHYIKFGGALHVIIIS